MWRADDELAASEPDCGDDELGVPDADLGSVTVVSPDFVCRDRCAVCSFRWSLAVV